MKFSEALKALNHKREKTFALVGPETFLKEYFVKTAKEVHPDYEFLEYSPETQQGALDIIGGENLFSSSLVVLRIFDKMAVAKFENGVKKFDGCIIFIIQEKADLKSRAMTSILSHAAIVECNKFKEYGNEYPSWITSYIISAGYKSQEGVSARVFFKVGPNMFSIVNELEKMFAVKLDKTITLNDVNKYVSNTAVNTSFELFENLIKRNVKDALMCFNSFAMAQDNFIEIVSFVGVYLEKLYRILLLNEKKMSADSIADIVGMPAYFVKTKYLPRALSLGKNFIAIKMENLCVVDAQLRLFKGSKRVIFERFIMSFAE